MSSTNPYRKRTSKFQKTMDLIISFLKAWKTGSYNQIPQLLNDIRTGDLRAMLPDMESNHRFFLTVIEVLKRPDLKQSHSEALYNLAVILSEKNDVLGLLELEAYEIVAPFLSSQDPEVVYRACWCLFGAASSSQESRDLCFSKGLVHVVLDKILHSEGKVRDIAGQIIYGSFHIRPPPADEYIEPLLSASCKLLDDLPEEVLKYILWAVHFATTTRPELLVSHGIAQKLPNHLSDQTSEVLIPLLIIISELFTSKSRNIIAKSVDQMDKPLKSVDSNVKLQACRTLAEFIQDEESVETLLTNKLYERLIRLVQDEELKVREQGVYAIMRGFGLGSQEQKKRLITIGGLEAILSYTIVSSTPFNMSLLDCMTSVAESSPELSIGILRKRNAVELLYPMLSSPDQQLSSKVANLIGLIGEKKKEV